MTGNATPAAVIAAADDRVVKPRRTKALIDRLDNLVFEATVQGAGHETLYQLPTYETTLQAAFGALRDAARCRPLAAATRRVLAATQQAIGDGVRLRFRHPRCDRFATRQTAAWLCASCDPARV